MAKYIHRTLPAHGYDLASRHGGPVRSDLVRVRAHPRQMRSGDTGIRCLRRSHKIVSLARRLEN